MVRRVETQIPYGNDKPEKQRQRLEADSSASLWNDRDVVLVFAR